jgi:hypothetical protein
MKTRLGFVSNSSSSSFVVVLPEWPKDKEHLSGLIFNGQTKYENPYFDPECRDNSPRNWPISEVVDVLWTQFQDQDRNMGVFEIAKELASGWVNEIDEILEREKDNFLKPEKERKYPEDKDYDKEHRRREDLAFEMARKFMEANDKGEWPCAYLKFSFSDNDGAFLSALEHGNLFEGLPHIVISHH